ncbi:MAG: hypothetical protein WDW36_003769 [Sanguina aurantia]
MIPMSLQELHSRLFPIDYDDLFFQKAVRSQDRIFSWAAIACDAVTGNSQLVGFVTARCLQLHECDTTDRDFMGLTSRHAEQRPVVYVLTLGVTETLRGQGVGRCLLGFVHQHGISVGAAMIFLHVISYNTAAIQLYGRMLYKCVGQLHSFYFIQSGRQPIQGQQYFDAYLYVLSLPTPWAPPRGPWDSVVDYAAAPFRWSLGRFNECLPWHSR